jgi:hypothetical protein
MEEFIRKGYCMVNELRKLNECRTFLNAVNFSESMTMNGEPNQDSGIKRTEI